MDKALNSSINLNRELLASDEYKQYIAAKYELYKFPQYREMVDDFRRKQVELEARKVNGQPFDLSEEFALSNEYADICLITVCNDFFHAEMTLLDMITAVYTNISEGLDIDMAFMKG